MHDREEEAASGGVGKLVVSDDSESCDWSEETRVFLLLLVPRRGGLTGTADGEQFEADNEEEEIGMLQLKSPILARQTSTDIC